MSSFSFWSWQGASRALYAHPPADEMEESGDEGGDADAEDRVDPEGGGGGGDLSPEEAASKASAKASSSSAAAARRERRARRKETTEVLLSAIESGDLESLEEAIDSAEASHEGTLPDGRRWCTDELKAASRCFSSLTRPISPICHRPFFPYLTFEFFF